MASKARQTRNAIQAYLDSSQTTLTDLADRVGVSKAMLSLVARGLRQPSLDVAFRIQQETGIPAETFARRVA